jgi:hypothetical protein
MLYLFNSEDATEPHDCTYKYFTYNDCVCAQGTLTKQEGFLRLTSSLR